jgi:diguanylate cyclase (GGDEF)-like protein/PAS domain S-box-containing protein
VAGVAASLAFSPGFWMRVADVILLLVIAIEIVACRPRRHLAAPADAARAERIDRAFVAAPIGMMVLSTDLEITRVNAALCTVLGRESADLVGRSVFALTHPEDIERTDEKRRSLLRGEDTGPVQKRYLRADGTVVEAVVTAVLIRPDHSPPYILSQLQDVTEQRRAKRRNVAVAELGHKALKSTDVIALMGDAMTLVSNALENVTCVTTRHLDDGGLRIVATTGTSLNETIVTASDTQTAYTLTRGGPIFSEDLNSETRFALPDLVKRLGLSRALSVPVPERTGARHVILAYRDAHGRPFTDEDARFLEAIAHVLSGALNRDATENELRRQALEDRLTGLANRALLNSQLDTELRHAKRLGSRVCVLAIDLDRFKDLNDGLGHRVGDALLRQVAARLRAFVRDEDLLARPGADEFVLVATRSDTDQAVADLAQRLLNAVAMPFSVERHEVFLTASIGVAVSDDGRETAEELLRSADAALSRARRAGGARYETSDAALRDRLVERMAIERDLRHAVERDQLELHYQPLVNLLDEQIIGFEALLRWRHPGRGLIPPDHFIHIAEETGLIIEIGSWVLSTVCEQLARWPERIRISANVSAVQIGPGLVTEVNSNVSRHHLAAGRLILEITESLVLDPRTKPFVTTLREAGVQLALDDFGTGYSSLGSLQRFPLDLLKLDRTLITSITDSAGHAAIVRAAVELGAALGVAVIAEGIDDQQQLDALRGLGCPLGQGYLFAKPLPAADAERLLFPPGAAKPASQTNRVA